MALSVKQGTITEPGSTGALATTGVGFQPKLLILYGNNATASGGHVDAVFCMGWAVSSSDCRYNSFASDDAVSVSRAHSRHSATHCYGIIAPTNTLLCEAALQSFDSDGFTLNWTTVSATGRLIHYLAIGGSDLTNVVGGQLTGRSSNGTTSVSGLAFEPDCVLLMSSNLGSAGTDTEARFSLGWGTASAQAVTATAAAHDLGDSSTAKFNSDAAIIAAQHESQGSGTYWVAELQSINSDGFTLNFTDTNGSSPLINYLCLKGAQFKVGIETQQTSATTKTTSSIGFAPSAVMLMTSGATATGSSASVTNTFGSGTATACGCAWWGDQNNVGTTRADSRTESALIYQHCTSVAGTPTINASAALSALGSDDFTLNYTAADASARRFMYLAIGAAEGGGDQALELTGLSSAEAFGSPTVSPGAVNVIANAVVSAEAIGSPTVAPGAATVQPNAISSAEALGEASLALFVAANAIATAETIGAPTLSPGAVTVSLDAIASAEALGSPTLALYVLPGGLGTAEAFGSPTLVPGAVTIAVSGLTSTEAIGAPVVVPGEVLVLPNAIDSAEAFGAATIVAGALTITPSGLASAGALGSTLVIPGAVTLTPSGMASAEALGTASLSLGAVILAPTGLGSAEAFGSPTLVPGAVSIQTTGISSAEAFGTALMRLYVAPSGIGSGEALGSPTFAPGVVYVLPAGLDSAEAFGATWVQIAAGMPLFVFPARDRTFYFNAAPRSFSFDARERVLKFSARLRDSDS